MAKWKVKAFVNSSVGVQTYEVESNTPYGARDLVQRMYDPEFIQSVEKTSSLDSYSGDGPEVAILIILFLWIFYVAAPFVLMFSSGAIGTWLAELISGQKLKFALDESLKTKKKRIVLFIIISALTFGGFGFYLGSEIHRNYFTPSINSSK